MIIYPRRVLSSLAGFLLALWLVVGRWSINRVESENVIPTLMRPRGWAVLGLIVCAAALMVPYPGASNRRLGARVWLAALSAAGFLGYMCVTSFWSPETLSASQKFVDLVQVLLVLAATLVIAVRGDLESVTRSLIKGVVVLTILLAGTGLMAALHGDGERLAVLGGGPNVFGRLMGLLAVWGSIRFAQRNAPIPAVLAVAAIALLILSGSRGAMVSVVVAVAFGQLVASPGKRLAVSALLGLGILAVIGLTPLGDAVVDMFRLRVLELTIGEGNLAHRGEIYRLAMDRGLRYPVLGCGLGSFVSTGWPYAHNLFLEAWSEGGIVGVLLVLASVVSGLTAILRDAGEERAMLKGWFVLIVVAAQFSGDIFDSRAIFILPLLALASERTGTPAAVAAMRRAP